MMKTKIVAHLLIKNQKGQYLILKRSLDNDVLPGFWDIPGGSVEDGESVSEGLRREVKEETGLSITDDPKIIGFIEFVDKVKDTHFVKLVFSSSVEAEDDSVVVNSSEHSEYRWVAKSEVDNLRLVEYLGTIFHQIND
ncbi:MAG TPA: NUDIX hydrolase [bacterium]|nr:NUDIX hydrolase [bacterium]